MSPYRLELRHVPRLVPEELRDLPPELLLRRALCSFRRRYGFVCLRIELVGEGVIMPETHPSVACPECDDVSNPYCPLCRGTDQTCPICECPAEECEYQEGCGDDDPWQDEGQGG